MAWTKAIPGFFPRLRTQLGKGTPVPKRTRGALDCNIRAGQHVFGRLTKDKGVPWVELLRGWMGRPGATGTNLWDTQRGFKKADSWLGKMGRKPIRGYMKFTKAAVRKAIRQKRIVMLAIDYGEFNKLMGKTGDPNYNGGHGVAVQGEKKWENGTIVWCLYDSLDDERRPGIPQGYRWVPRSKVIRAAEKWAKRTNGTEVIALVARGGGAK